MKDLIHQPGKVILGLAQTRLEVVRTGGTEGGREGGREGNRGEIKCSACLNWCMRSLANILSLPFPFVLETRDHRLIKSDHTVQDSV